MEDTQYAGLYKRRELVSDFGLISASDAVRALQQVFSYYQQEVAKLTLIVPVRTPEAVQQEL